MSNDGDEKTSVSGVEEKTQPSQTSLTLVGREFGGRYRILRPLARGGMGVVYLAEQIQLKRTVVFKILSYELSTDEKSKARFEREAHGLSALQHPNIVGIFDFGDEDGMTYIVMEYVDGQTLSARLKECGRLPFNDFMGVAIQVLEALAAAHDRGIVHRDIKPSNIMLTTRHGKKDLIKVLDFGLAREVRSSHDVTKGRLVGTVSYLAPEVITGERATERSDVYALGVMFYQLLTGKRPFEGADEMSVLYQHVNAMPKPLEEILAPGEVPQEVIDVVHLCLSKDPALRPSSARALQQIFAGAVSWPSLPSWSLEHTPSPRHMTPALPRPVVRREEVEAPVEEPPEPPIVHRRNPWVFGFVAFVAVLSVFIGLAVLVNALDSKPAELPTVAPDPVVQRTPVATVDPKPAEPAPAQLEVRSSPPGSVTIDGIERGASPVSVTLMPGRHLVAIDLEGHQSWQEWVEFDTGVVKSLDVVLAAIPPANTSAKTKKVQKPAKSTARVTTRPVEVTPVTEPEVEPVRTEQKPMFKPDLKPKKQQGLLPMK